MTEQLYAMVLAGALAVANTFGVAQLMSEAPEEKVSRAVTDLGYIEVAAKREVVDLGRIEIVAEREPVDLGQIEVVTQRLTPAYFPIVDVGQIEIVAKRPAQVAANTSQSPTL